MLILIKNQIDTDIVIKTAGILPIWWKTQNNQSINQNNLRNVHTSTKSINYFYIKTNNSLKTDTFNLGSI